MIRIEQNPLTPYAVRWFCDTCGAFGAWQHHARVTHVWANGKAHEIIKHTAVTGERSLTPLRILKAGAR